LPIAVALRRVAEHSSVMSVVLISSYLKNEALAVDLVLPFRKGTGQE
jgi:hypothetical protein